MKKLSKINEGMFDNGIRRAHTQELREEDNVDNLDYKDFYMYIYKTYESTIYGYPIKMKICKENNIDVPVILIPIMNYDKKVSYPEYMTIEYHYDNNIDVYVGPGIFNEYIIMTNILKTNGFNLRKAYELKKVYPETGEMTHSLCLKLLNLLINTITNPMVKKRK